MVSAFVASQVLNYGLPVPDPRTQGEFTHAWSLNLLTTMPFAVEEAKDMLLAFEIIGVPTHKPLVGDTYSLALVFERTTIEDTQPLVDGVWVHWEIGNGPRAQVTAIDTFSDTGKTGADL